MAMNNSLAEVHPELITEWSEKNLPLTPDDITFGSNKKVWWKGACGHEWQTSIKARSNGEKCPICSGARVIAGINDLQTTHPEIASEWSEKNLPLKPDEVNAKSRKNVWWRCGKCGNEWKSVINARVKGTVCPVCAEREVLAGYNDLATTDNQLLSEWDYEQNKLKPTEVSRTSAKRAWWKCRHGHSWSMKINERTILNKGCRICEQEYLSLFPALAVSYYSNKKGLKAELGRMATESGFVRYTFEKVIRLKEIFAAKGNALITRAVARDLYDWCNMVSEGLFEEQRDLFRKCR